MTEWLVNQTVIWLVERDMYYRYSDWGGWGIKDIYIYIYIYNGIIVYVWPRSLRCDRWCLICITMDTYIHKNHRGVNSPGKSMSKKVWEWGHGMVCAWGSKFCYISTILYSASTHPCGHPGYQPHPQSAHPIGISADAVANPQGYGSVLEGRLWHSSKG